MELHITLLLGAFQLRFSFVVARKKEKTQCGISVLVCYHITALSTRQFRCLLYVLSNS